MEFKIKKSNFWTYFLDFNSPCVEELQSWYDVCALGCRLQHLKASLGRVASLSEDIPHIIVAEDLPQCQRMGIMAAFNSFSAFKDYFNPIIEMFSSPPNTPDIDSSYVDKYQKV